MRIIRLGGTDIDTSALGFGCADLFRAATSTARLRLLEAAFDAGIRHFDVAPMYGLGFAEAELGRFARTRRDRIVIATKCGIEPTAMGRLVGRVQVPIQRALRVVGRRSSSAGPDPRAGIVGSLLYRPNDYGPRAARASLERSLRALRTDYVDLLLLHDPRNAAEVPDGIRTYLESARSEGRIRAWGVAGERAPTVATARHLGGGVPVLQVRGDVFSRVASPIPDEIASASILYGVVGRALAKIRARLEADLDAQRRWSDALGADVARPEVLADLLLRDALDANPAGPVLFATTRPERVVAAAVIAGRSDSVRDAAIPVLRSLAAVELGMTQAAR